MPHTWIPANGVHKRLLNAALAVLLTFTTLVIIPGSVPAADAATNHEFQYVIVFQNGETVSGTTNDGSGNTAFVPDVGGANIPSTEAGMLIHMSCSDSFNLDKDPADPSYGYSDAGAQPQQDVDTAWRIADYAFRRTGTSGGQCGNLDLFDRPARAAIDIDKVTNGSDGLNIPAGSPVVWTYTVTNAGRLPLSNIAVSDDQPGVTPSYESGDTNGNDLLDLSETWVFKADGIAVTGDYENIGTAEGQYRNTTPSATDGSSYFGTSPALGIDKTSETTSISAPGTINYTITVSNGGNVKLTGITVSDPMLGGDITASCIWPGTDFELLVGESADCGGSYDATQDDIDQGDDIINTATANSNETGTEEDDHTVTIANDPSLIVSKTGEWTDESGDGYAQAGETISYSFVVTNNGNVTLLNVSLDDLVGHVTVAGGPIASLVPGESDLTTFTASYVLTQDDIDAGTFYNQAQACGTDPNGSEICDDDDHEEPLPQNPSIGVVKDVDPTTITGGQATEVTWTITVTNTGNVTLHDVVVTDALVATCDLIIGDLPVGGSSTHSCKSTHTPDVPTWSFTNVAIANGVGPLGTAVTAQDDATVIPVFIAASGTIGDTVWSDENANGVQDNGEKGIAGAKVKLTLPDGTTAEAITNANGLYLFSGLDAGQYTVELIMSSIPAPADGENKLTTAGSFTIQLADGQSYLDADFGIVATLPKTGIASDQIALIALAMLLAGGLALLTTRKKEFGEDTEGSVS
jgi:uncharacterized repeat protein (TIGR01451 family)/LPXTG-motif cell wall-anchored protein